MRAGRYGWRDDPRLLLCRDETGSDAHPRAGDLLAANVAACLASSPAAPITLKTVECLGNCKRRLSAAILRDGCWSYVFGDLSVDSGADLVAGGQPLFHGPRRHPAWRGRTDCLKRGLVARIPPLSLLEDPS